MMFFLSATKVLFFPYCCFFKPLPVQQNNLFAFKAHQSFIREFPQCAAEHIPHCSQPFGHIRLRPADGVVLVNRCPPDQSGILPRAGERNTRREFQSGQSCVPVVQHKKRITANVNSGYSFNNAAEFVYSEKPAIRSRSVPEHLPGLDAFSIKAGTRLKQSPCPSRSRICSRPAGDRRYISTSPFRMKYTNSQASACQLMASSALKCF